MKTQKYLTLLSLLIVVKDLSATTIVKIPNPSTDPDQGIIKSLAISPLDDTVYFGGIDNDSNQPLAWKYDGITLSVIPPPNMDNGSINAIGVALDGTAYFAGTDLSANVPLIWKYANGVLLQLTAPSIGITAGSFNALAIDTNGPPYTAYFGGAVNIAGFPHPIVFQYDGTTLSHITNANGDRGNILCAGIDSTGLVYFGGRDITSSEPLVWQYNGSSITAIPNPNTEHGEIGALAVAPQGTVYFGGSNASMGIPLLWQYDGSLTQFTLPNTDAGSISCVGVDANGTAYFGGGDTSSFTALVYQYSLGALHLLTNPNTAAATIESVAVNSDVSPYTVYFGGENFSGDEPLVWTFDGVELSQLTTPDTRLGQLIAAGVNSNGTAYLAGGLLDAPAIPVVYTSGILPPTPTPSNLPTYDIHRLRPIYESQLEKTRERLEDSNFYSNDDD